MAKKDPIVTLLEALKGDIAGHVRGDGTAIFEKMGEINAARVARLDTARDRLEAELGPDHPRVLTLRGRSSYLGGVSQELNRSVARIKKAGELRPHEWLAFGRVVDDAGEPQGGFRVRVFDKDHQHDDLLGDAETDDLGEFRSVYHARDFAENEEDMPELYVMVNDARGKLLYTSEESVRPGAGRVEYFEIVLSQERIRKGAPRVRCEAVTAKGTQCKNSALPGTSLCSRHSG